MPAILSGFTLMPRQFGRHFAYDIFKCIFFNENVWFPIEMSLKVVPRDPIANIPSLVQIMAWRRPGDKPLSEAMMVSLLTYTVNASLGLIKLINLGNINQIFTNDIMICSFIQSPYHDVNISYLYSSHYHTFIPLFTHSWMKYWPMPHTYIIRKHT